MRLSICIVAGHTTQAICFFVCWRERVKLVFQREFRKWNRKPVVGRHQYTFCRLKWPSFRYPIKSKPENVIGYNLGFINFWRRFFFRKVSTSMCMCQFRVHLLIERNDKRIFLCLTRKMIRPSPFSRTMSENKTLNTLTLFNKSIANGDKHWSGRRGFLRSSDSKFTAPRKNNRRIDVENTFQHSNHMCFC